ncbi:MAG TPA: nucleotide-binding protein [Caulobacterales bacterium]|nr:nucleotide-binding protein [Caulobacterales bacterium]
MQSAIAKLNRRLGELKEFDAFALNSRSDGALTGLKTRLEDTHSQIFPPDTHEYRQYANAFHLYEGPYNYAYEVTKQEWASAINESRDELVGRLDALVVVFNERIADAVPATASAPAESRKATPQRVFIVHGRDDEAKNAVALLLRKLGVQGIILHDQANRGATLIEKFESNSECDFAVILLTPDDEGRHKNDGALLPRARQNVVLEMGFFVAKLTRKNVCALYVPGVELPSDVQGIAYVEIDERGRWEFELASELKAAGFPIDLNKLARG